MLAPIPNLQETLIMKKRLFSLLSMVVVLSLFLTSPAAAKANPTTLQPGETVTYEQKVPINIVFIGYNRDMINREALRGQLPRTYEPVVRYPQFYGLQGREMGLKFNFEYNFNFTEKDFADRFFGYLQEIGVPNDPTLFQLQYNDQKKNVLDVTGPVLYIDAPSVDAWLAENLSVNPNSYTVVFINWYSRPDFQFHVYTKTDEPDPDTGYNFGEIRASRKMIAWGGTSSRVWFYDLSAGPESWTANWNVDDKDVDGDGVPDYRMPPIWEYTQRGYRKPGALSKDLGLVTRFVGINLLFTSSPLYDPLATAPDVGGDKIVHITVFEDDPKNLGTDWIDAAAIQSEFESVFPYYSWQVHVVDVNPIDAGARRALRIFAGLRQRNDCWNNFGTPFAQLFCYFNANLDKYVPAYEEGDYVLPIFAFNTTDRNLGDQFGLLGFADDDWMSGLQTFVFEFATPGYRDLGYGLSAVSIHEAGHHFGLSHPHDGYDSELGIDYGPTGDFFFAWSGDESHTIMSYLFITREFGQFDQDNMYRYEFAGYLNWANSLLDDILAHPDVANVQDNIDQAQMYAQQAVTSFQNWDYLNAAMNARLAYEQIALAADELGITTPTDEERLRVDTGMTAPHEGDPIRFPDN
jgi:hypothetical protein